MSRRTPHVPQRTLVFVGCEGESEVGYVGLVDFLAKAAGLPVHLHAERLSPGCGDPLARVERSIARLAKLRTTRGGFRHRFILMDADQRARHPERSERAIRLAADNAIEIIWQEPSHEAFLLRHLPGRAAHRPADSRLALQALQRDWPDYGKPMTRLRLSARLDAAALRGAAAVEPGLARLLAAVGL